MKVCLGNGMNHKVAFNLSVLLIFSCITFSYAQTLPLPKPKEKLNQAKQNAQAKFSSIKDSLKPAKPKLGLLRSPIPKPGLVPSELPPKSKSIIIRTVQVMGAG
jgi:hypothetical protein